MKRFRLLRVIASIVLAVSFLGLTSASAAPSPPRAPVAPRGTAAPRGRAAPASPKATGFWANIPAPTGAPERPLFGVATAASNDAWAVGGAISATVAMGSAAQVYHWNGTLWSAVTNTTYLTLEHVALIPGVADQAIAVGQNEAYIGEQGSFPGLVETCEVTGTIDHCTRDSTVPATVNPTQDQVKELDGASALSATDYWAVGGGGGYAPYPEYGVILHHTASGWTSVSLSQTLPVTTSIPATVTLPSVHYWGVQMLSDGEGWAVGDGQNSSAPGTIIHYTPATAAVSGTWSLVKTGLTFSGPLHAVWFTSPLEGWVVGGNISTHPVILHYKASATPQWSTEGVSSLPLAVNGETQLWAVDMLPDGSGYAAGNDGQVLYRSTIDASEGISPTWSSVFTDCGSPSSNTCTYPPLYGVSVTPDGKKGWAGGGNYDDVPRFDEMTMGTLGPYWQWLPTLEKNP